jgi:transcriptional regulator with XRE-family HTH domain
VTSTSSTPPAVARRRVSLALRRAREAKQWTQTQVANAMEWSLSKVMRIEKGQVNISPSDLRSVLAVLDVTDVDEISDLLADVRVSRSERYTNDDFDRERLTPATVQLIQYEMEATSIWYYNNVAIPGILQTSAYARRVLESFEGELDESTIQARLEARMARRARVFGRKPAPEYLVILDESVLRRTIGSASIMADQLTELMKVIEETNLRVRIVPFTAGTPVVLTGPFMILDLIDLGHTFMYTESSTTIDTWIDNQDQVLRYSERFARVWDGLPAEDESLAIIQTAAKIHRSAS